MLGALRSRRPIECIQRVMLAGDQRMRANGIEAIGLLPHRRFVLPLLPVIEATVTPSAGWADGSERETAQILA